MFCERVKSPVHGLREVVLRKPERMKLIGELSTLVQHRSQRSDVVLQDMCRVFFEMRRQRVEVK